MTLICQAARPIIPTDRDPGNQALDDLDGEVVGVICCEYVEPGLCWPCTAAFLLVLFDLPFVFVDLDDGMAIELDGAAAAYLDLERALYAFTGWLEIEQDDTWTESEIEDLAEQMKQLEAPHSLLHPVVLALAAAQYLRANRNEPEPRDFSHDISTAAARARKFLEQQP